MLSYQAEAALRTGSLALALEQFEPMPWPVNLVYPGSRMLPLKLRAFLDFAAPRLKLALSASNPACPKNSTEKSKFPKADGVLFWTHAEEESR